jgi:hypothetical protein
MSKNQGMVAMREGPPPPPAEEEAFPEAGAEEALSRPRIKLDILSSQKMLSPPRRHTSLMNSPGP